MVGVMVVLLNGMLLLLLLLGCFSSFDCSAIVVALLR